MVNRLEWLEITGVMMRILAFGFLSVMGKETPFLWLWVWNTLDAGLLTYCAVVRRNRPYILLNTFWMIVGIVGIVNSL